MIPPPEPAITNAASCLVYADWQEEFGDEINAAYWRLVGEVRMVLDPVLNRLRTTHGRAVHEIRLPHDFRLFTRATPKQIRVALYDYRSEAGIARRWACIWKRHATSRNYYTKKTHEVVRRIWDLQHPSCTPEPSGR